MKLRRKESLKFILADLIAAIAAWAIFFFYRKLYIEKLIYGDSLETMLNDTFFIGIIVIPLSWLIFYTLTGEYTNVLRKARLKVIGQTILHSIIGCTVLFFALLLDDDIISYRTYYRLFSTLLLLHFSTTLFFRLILTTIQVKKVQRREIGFNTLLIGSDKNALALYKEMEAMTVSQGNKFVGYIHMGDDNKNLMNGLIPNLGTIKELITIINEQHIEEVIIAIESSEHNKLGEIINALEDYDVIIKVIPDMYDILSGSVKLTAIFGAPLIVVKTELMPEWQSSLKRIIDVCSSVIVLIFLLPILLLLATLVRISSRGPIFYSHLRIGLHGKPFRIYKFRSMYIDSENGTPQLASKEDKRITPVGRYLRRFRLDELPQFWNVLIGDMSLVGPRPERQFFIDQITLQAPHYKHLHKVRPGITSWGQVKYGYAENVEQMITRLKFDIMYIENMSLALDFKILFYTVLIVIQGRGK